MSIGSYGGLLRGLDVCPGLCSSVCCVEQTNLVFVLIHLPVQLCARIMEVLSLVNLDFFCVQWMAAC